MIKLFVIYSSVSLSLSLFFFLSRLLLSWSRELQQAVLKSLIVTLIILLVKTDYEDNCSPSATLLLILLPTTKSNNPMGSLPS